MKKATVCMCVKIYVDRFFPKVFHLNFKGRVGSGSELAKFSIRIGICFTKQVIGIASMSMTSSYYLMTIF